MSAAVALQCAYWRLVHTVTVSTVTVRLLTLRLPQAWCIDFAHGGVAKLISDTARAAAWNPDDRQKTIDLLVDIWHGEPSPVWLLRSSSFFPVCANLPSPLPTCHSPPATWVHRKEERQEKLR